MSYSWWKYSLDPDQLASPEISLSVFILFSNDTLEIVNVISYTWWKKSLDPDQLASLEISLSVFILFSNDALEIVNVISYTWWKNSLDPDQLASPEISLSDFILFSNDTLEIVNVISYSWLYHILGEKQSGPRSAGFTINQLIWLHTVFKWYSWIICYILLLVRNSLDPDQLASPEISLSDFILFSNDTLEIVNVISYSWWKTVWTQISWRHQKSAYLTSYCFQTILLNYMLYPTLGEKQSGPKSAGFTRNQLIWLRNVFKWYSWNSKCYIYSWWKTVWTQFSWLHQKSAYLTSYCFSNDPLEIVNAISYSWQKKQHKQSGLWLAGFTRNQLIWLHTVFK